MFPNSAPFLIELRFSPVYCSDFSIFSICGFQKVAELSQHDPSLPFVRLNVGGSLFTPLRDTLKASTFFEDLLAEVERGRIKLPTDPRYAFKAFVLVLSIDFSKASQCQLKKWTRVIVKFVSVTQLCN